MTPAPKPPGGVELSFSLPDEVTVRQTYAAWRLAQFGSGTTPEGDPAFDADADGLINHDEFIAGTHPLDSASFLEHILFNLSHIVRDGRSWCSAQG